MADIVYVKGGKEIPGDVYVTYGQIATQPMYMTPDQMTAARVTTAPLQPMPDPFYGPVEKDPANPGGWVQTLYAPDELKLRLRDFSTGMRWPIETGGLLLSGGAFATSSARDTRAAYNTGSVNMAADATLTALTVKLYPVAGGAMSSVASFTNMDKATVDQTNKLLTRLANACLSTESAIAVDIDGGTITTKEQIVPRYNSLKRNNPDKVPPS